MTLDIYTTGHPRSGNTWLGRLLSDILKAEYVAGTPAPDGHYDAQYWGEGETWQPDFRVWKTHAREKPPGPTVFVYRDPRDVICSIWHYRDRYPTIENVIETLAQHVDDQTSDRYGKYEDFVRTWWNTGKAEAQIRYEDMHLQPVRALGYVIFKLTGLNWSSQDINNGVFRQEFSRIKTIKAPTQDHAMWTGQPGNWRNYFTRRDADLTQALLGDLMLEQGYITSPDWVHELKL